jgi:hypothetical protein
MIAKAFKYKSGRASAQRLNRHLWKSEGQPVELSEIRNLYVPNSEAGMRVMRCLQQGSNAEIVFWHIIISPTTTLNGSDRTRVVNLVVAELAAESHPLLVWSHLEKPRARKGGGACHWHLVLGHISPTTGLALDMRNHAQRLQKAMAIAAFDIEGQTTVSPFHRSIVAYLSKEGRGDVAAWLTDLAATTPCLQRPRMTEAMRRSAAAVGFELPSFQAKLERLWVTGASQEAADFLSSVGVSVRRGDHSPHAILLYREDLLVGVMNRILRRPSFPVYEEAMLRFPDLFNKPRIIVAVSRDPRSSSREAALRQEKIDRLEEMLRHIKTEVLMLTYNPPQPLRVASEGEAKPNAERLGRLAGGAAILETSIALLWNDDRWASVPIEKLLKSAKRLLTRDKPSPAARTVTRDGGTETKPEIEDRADARDEDEMSMGPLLRP